MMPSLLLKNIKNCYSAAKNSGYGQIEEKNNIDILIREGLISEIHDASSALHADEIIDCSDKTVLPGFVDCHTHPVFWKTREDEFIMRVQGKSYEEIAMAGGGIRNSVRKFRQASKDQIKKVTAERIKKFFEYGTTTIEAKSGYGLSCNGLSNCH